MIIPYYLVWDSCLPVCAKSHPFLTWQHHTSSQPIDQNCHLAMIHFHVLWQAGTREDDYPLGILGFHLQVERISAAILQYYLCIEVWSDNATLELSTPKMVTPPGAVGTAGSNTILCSTCTVKALSRSTVILFCGVQFHMVKVAKKVYQEMKMAWQWLW